MDAAAKGVRIHQRDFAVTEAEDGTSAEGLVPLGYEQGRAVLGMEDPGRVPSADHLFDGSVMVAQPVAAAKREIVVVNEIEDVRVVEERGPVLEFGEEARRIVACGVLHRAHLVERFGVGVVGVELQAVPTTIVQRYDHGVVVRHVAAGAHEQVEYLEVVEGGQTARKTEHIHRNKQRGHRSVYEVACVSARDASGARSSSTRQQILEPRLWCYGSARNSRPQLRSHGVKGLSKCLP